MTTCIIPKRKMPKDIPDWEVLMEKEDLFSRQRLSLKSAWGDLDDIADGTDRYAVDGDEKQGAYSGFLGLTADGFVQQIIKGVVLPEENPNVSGLYATGKYFGFHNGNGLETGWTVFIKYDGKFYFTGDGNNYITWNGAALVVSGQIVVLGGSSGYDNLSDKPDSLGDINSGELANLNAVYDGTIKYRSTGAPTNNPAPSGISNVSGKDGSVDITIQWSQYTQGAKQADMLLVFFRADGSAPTVNDSCIAFNVNTTSNSYYIFQGLSPEKSYSFGIAAARRTENGLEIGAIQAPTSSPDWRGVTYGDPNFTGNINGETAANIRDWATRAGTGLDGNGRIIKAIIGQNLEAQSLVLGVDPSGLYIGKTCMGYWSTVDGWKSYFDNAGNAVFTGTLYSTTLYTGKTLTVNGKIVAGGGSIEMDAFGLRLDTYGVGDLEFYYNGFGNWIGTISNYPTGGLYIIVPTGKHIALDSTSTGWVEITAGRIGAAGSTDVVWWLSPNYCIRPYQDRATQPINFGHGSYRWNYGYFFSLGDGTTKITQIYRTNEYACPLPTTNSALGVIRKMIHPQVSDGDFGNRHYFAEETFPDEMTAMAEGKKTIEMTRVAGVTLEAIRELTSMVDSLVPRIKALEEGVK